VVPMASAAATNALSGGTSNRPGLMPSGSLAKVCDTVLGNELVASMLQSEAHRTHDSEDKPRVIM